ncbi:MAG: iron-sulfur cluster assembly scaffold protein [Anaerolineae bacterium]|nr:iron-sulfur cluster assembly scaffold protein [Anaerolineae bacterium]
MEHQKEEQTGNYSARIMEEATNPRHMRRMPDADAMGIIHGCCGDTMELYLRLEGGSIQEATFMTDGHEPARASANLLCTMVAGLSLEAAAQITPAMLSEALGGLPEAKLHCAKLAAETLHKALVSGKWAGSYHATLRKALGHALLLVPSAAACIRNATGEILLVRRGDGAALWGFPGGIIEPGESALDAVKREVCEEIGLEIEPLTLIGVYTSPEYIFIYPNGDQVQPMTFFFECRVVGGDLRPDFLETLEARYFGPEEELPPMRPCCVAKARDAFAFRGQVFLH